MTRFRGIPPRQLIRLRDAASQLPTNARTISTSDRTGKQAIGAFNDTHVIIFQAGSKETDVSSPLALERSLAERVTSFIDLASITSSIDYESASAIRPATIAGISDVFIERSSSLNAFQPYVESRQYEQCNTSSFYLTGVNVDGFTGNVRDKTIIRLTLPNTSVYTLQSTTASLAYYNVSQGRFQRVGTNTNPADSYALRGSDEGVQVGIPPASSGAVNYAHDARLFGPFGNMIASGSYAANGGLSYNCVSNLLGQRAHAYMPEALRQVGDRSVTVNSSFAATSEFLLPISASIVQPFLIEKIVIELPLSASTDWLNDTTTLNYCDTFGQDVGGPCITVALLNQFSSTHRDVIASGTIVPVGDNISELYNPGGTSYGHVAPHGFAAFAKPTAVVSGTSAGFTGTVTLEMLPATSNGVFTTSFRTSSFETTVGTFDASRIRMINKLGRAMSAFGSGRSFFGGDHAADANGFNPSMNNVSGNRVDAFLLNDSIHSPYIIKPTDQLVLSVSKHRAVATNPVTTILGGNRQQLTSSHTVGINVGDVQITFYGSLIVNGRQLHSYRNEPLTSLNMIEAIDDVVVDLHDLAPRTMFSGTYVDLYISGVISGATPDAAAANQTFRRVIGSAVAGTTSLSPNRFVKLRSRELIYDSLLPAVADIQLIDGADIVAFRQSSTSSIDVLTLPLRSDPGVVSITHTTNGDDITENSRWPLAFPYEARYNALTRVIQQNRSTTSTALYTLGNGSADSFSTSSNFVHYGPIDAIMRTKSNHAPNTVGGDTGYGTASLEHLQNSNPSAGASTYFGRQLDTGIFNIGFFGFGDAAFNQPRYIEIERTYQPTTSPLTSSYRHEFHTNVAIRGWKYGVYDGNPTPSQMIVSMYHHGHMRDVLEQRQFTKHSNDGITSRQGVVSCRFVVTSSVPSGSNSSNELTSSTPYFDGLTRN